MIGSEPRFAFAKLKQETNASSILTMEFDSKGPVLKLLLIIGGQPSRMETPKELLPFPDGRSAFEHALSTLHSAVPSASTIYISIYDQSLEAEIELRLKDLSPIFNSNTPTGHEHSDILPSLQVLPVLGLEPDIGPAASILAAHSLHPDSNWLVLSCDYPLLPASAIQQLILEYSPPVTCFLNENGIAQPMIGIWGPEALSRLRNNVAHGYGQLVDAVKAVDGKLVRTLRKLWTKTCNTMAEWEEIAKILRGENSDG